MRASQFYRLVSSYTFPFTDNLLYFISIITYTSYIINRFCFVVHWPYCLYHFLVINNICPVCRNSECPKGYMHRSWWVRVSEWASERANDRGREGGSERANVSTGFHYDNLQYRQWRQSWHHDNYSFSAYVDKVVIRTTPCVNTTTLRKIV